MLPEGKTIAIHCSAGIGRSAVLACCLAIYRQLKNGKSAAGWKDLNPSIFELVERCRTQRNPFCV